MKHSILISFLFISTIIGAQEKPKNAHLSLGFKLHQTAKDFGLGGEVTSPLFAHNSIGIRASASVQYLEYYDFIDNETTWEPYTSYRLGMVGIGGRPLPFLKLYGEGGLQVTAASSSISTETIDLGGYGLFGFEMFMSNDGSDFISYYIELGGAGGSAVADKLTRKPLYNNGFLIGTGFRLYL